ncbi:MAG TPA: 1-deoxy-D-xylulose-5-phosphate reductoisomerase [Candidatus Sulfotelmatobacter sp.]|nr:1-deoxy-D-xylulose-5-phosphate reductoisomerase [Candidatus Sulfotelmatobacter sp.]
MPSARPAESAPPCRVAVLGSTGSIGRQALEVLDGLRDRFQVVALAGRRDTAVLAAQAARLRPRVVAAGEGQHVELPPAVQLQGAPDPLLALATRDDVDVVIVATGGLVSLPATLAALTAGKVVATANKETLVAGGHLVMPLARRQAAAVAVEAPDDPQASPLGWLRPIDSEHSAIWQCLAGEHLGEVARLILTASGGPFRDGPGDLEDVRPADALAHPTWHMGAKITIDSATLMNKGLEVIEAHWLYDVPYDRVAVVVHPQSIIHSAVEFVDGSLKAQLGLPDMRLPIQYALTYPRRVPSPARAVSLADVAALTFQPVDETRFPALALARRAGALGPRATAALIAADEVAVERFLAGSLSFPRIWRLAETAVDRFGDPGPTLPGLDEVLALDAEVRHFSRAFPGRA